MDVSSSERITLCDHLTRLSLIDFMNLQHGVRKNSASASLVNVTLSSTKTPQDQKMWYGVEEWNLFMSWVWHFLLFCGFGQATSLDQVSSSLPRGFWSMQGAWASPSSSGSSVEASVLWGHCATPSWESPSPNLGEITPMWRKSLEDWWGRWQFWSIFLLLS